MTKHHWHVMNGSIGCLPDNNQISDTKQSAIESACNLFDESHGLKTMLTKYHIAYKQECNLIGADYVEIYPCNNSECLEYPDD